MNSASSEVLLYSLGLAPRFAEPLGQLTSQWLGRSLTSQHRLSQPAHLKRSDLHEATGGARNTGFHGLLHPPFALSDGVSETELRYVMNVVAAAESAVEVMLEVKLAGAFVVMVPSLANKQLDLLAAEFVRQLVDLRQLPTDDELDRIRRAGLNDRQELMLRRWGAPHVLEEFHFHFPLAGPVPTADRRGVLETAAEWFAPCTEAPTVLQDLVLAVKEPHFPWVEQDRTPFASPLGSQ